MPAWVGYWTVTKSLCGVGDDSNRPTATPAGVTIVDIPRLPTGGETWDTATLTFRDPAPPMVPQWRLDLRAVDPATGAPKTEVFALAPGELPTAAKTIYLRGQVVDGANAPLSINAGPFIVQTPHPRGGHMFVRYRLSAGRLELQRADGTWVADIPFFSYESQEVDLGQSLRNWFELVSPVTLRVLLSR